VISFVNGFLCTCSCDVAKAERGVNPHPSTDKAQKPATKDGMAVTDKGAVVLGGSLAAATNVTASAVTAASAGQSPAQVNAQAPGQTVNLLV
jgi:hypothetical protein